MTEPFTITPENRDHYIAEALPFCDNVAALFVRQAHLYGWRADLESIARLKMMEIIDRLMKTGETVFNKTHFFAKLRISVRRRLIDASEEFRIVRTPRRRGKPSTKKEPAVVATHGAILVDNRLALDFSCDGTLKNPPATKEVLIERCRDGLDLSILIQALNGRTRKEIANDLRIPQREVRNRCGRLLKAGPA